jgi:hypothetical protein
MKSNNSWRTRLAQILIGAAMILALLAAREAKADGEHDHDHLVTDWTHRYVVYSAPTTLMQKFQLSGDRRYIDQLRRRGKGHGRGDNDGWRWRRAHDGAGEIKGDWSEDMGSGATVGAGNYPAKFSFDTTSANCVTPAPPVGQQPDYVVYNTGLSGSSANIVAYTNLYTGTCTGGEPQTYWAYNTGLAGAVVTSPFISYDGTQVAFVQSTATAATLVVIRWKASNGTIASPVTPSTGTCTSAADAPCMVTVPFSSANGDTNPTDTLSSPFYDFGGDAIYVGDNAGYLHKFIGILGNAPQEVVCTATTITLGCQSPAGTDTWPVLLTSFGHINNPVYIQSVNEVLVTASDGVLYGVDATAGGTINVTNSTVNGTNKLAGTGFDDGPLVDVTTGNVYVFARADNGPGFAGVFEVPIPATPGALHGVSGTEVTVSTNTTGPASAFYIGAFTDDYFSSGNGTGDLLVCGTSGGLNAVWDITINGGAVSPPAVAGPALTTANVGCSPITEFSADGITDTIFLSVAGSAVTAAPVSCPSASGCIMSYDVTDLSTWGATSATAARAAETGGTSGIVIDNGSGSAGASQIYFTPLADQLCTTSGGTGGCAIQASQSALD